TSWCSTCPTLPPGSASRPGWPPRASPRFRRSTTGRTMAALPTRTQTGRKAWSRPGSTGRLPTRADRAPGSFHLQRAPLRSRTDGTAPAATAPRQPKPAGRVLDADDLLGKLAGACGGLCFRARGAGCQRAVDDQEELAGGACGLWVAELAEF